MKNLNTPTGYFQLNLNLKLPTEEFTHWEKSTFQSWAPQILKQKSKDPTKDGFMSFTFSSPDAVWPGDYCTLRIVKTNAEFLIKLECIPTCVATSEAMSVIRQTLETIKHKESIKGTICFVGDGCSLESPEDSLQFKTLDLFVKDRPARWNLRESNWFVQEFFNIQIENGELVFRMLPLTC